MRFTTLPYYISGALLITLLPCAPAQAPKPRTVLEGLTKDVSAITLSPDGKMLVSASLGMDPKQGGKSWSDFRVWDVKTGKVLASFQGHDDYVHSIALSPDGATLASLDKGGSLILWSMADRKARHSHHAAGLSTTLAFSADGKRVGVVSETGILIWDAATGAAQPSVNYRGRLGGHIFSPDLGLVAVSCHQDVDLLDAVTGKLRRTLPDHHGTACPAAFSADGKMLAVDVSRDDESSGPFTEIVLWEVATGAQRVCVKDVGYCRGLAFSADGKRLALLSETKFRSESYELRVIDVVAGRSAPVVPLGRKKRLGCIFFSGDGKTLAVGSNGAVQVYDMP
jgi:WD40 repeat protein